MAEYIPRAKDRGWRLTRMQIYKAHKAKKWAESAKKGIIVKNRG